MGAEMEIPIMAQILTVIFSVLTLFVMAAHERVLAWLRSGVKHTIKFAVTGVKYTAKAKRHKEASLMSTLPRPKKI